MHLTDSAIKIGQKLTVVGFTGEALLIERLREIGLYQGLELVYLGRAPFKGPLLIQFDNTSFALRPEEARCTLVN